jgi:hypothetical protein
MLSLSSFNAGQPVQSKQRPLALKANGQTSKLKFGDSFQSQTVSQVQPVAATDDTKNQSKMQAAMATLQKLQEAQKKPMLDDQDQASLNQLRKLIGLPDNSLTPSVFSVQSYNTLSATDPKKRDELLSSAADMLRASLAATQSSSIQKRVGDQLLFIHNSQLAPFIKENYSANDLSQLFTSLQKMGVFDLKTHEESGLPYTTIATHNKAMNYQWNTDSIEIGKNMQRFLNPENYKRNLLANAAVMNTGRVQDALANVIQDPNWYRQSTDPMHGFPHIFDPDSIHPDPATGAPVVSIIGFDPNWHNQKRLESAALVLRALTENLKDGLVPNLQGQIKPWGFNQDFLKNPAQFQQVTNAIGNIAIYLSRINLDPATGRYDMKAPSASSWEEQPLKGGCTSDTGDAVLAFESLRDLLHNPQYNQNPGVQKVRQALQEHPYASAIPNLEQMNQMIDTGRQVIKERVIDPLSQGKSPRQSEARDADTSLTFLAASDYKFDPTNVNHDTQIRMGLLKAMENQLMRPNGMMRYGENLSPEGDRMFDSYLQLDSHLPEDVRQPLHTTVESELGLVPYNKNKLPSHDVTDKQGQLARQSGGSEKYTAQWGLGVSAGLQTLANTKINLLANMLQKPTPPTPEDQTTLTQVDKELTKYLNKNLALITGKDQNGQPPISSTGLPLPENKVMEAYEYVLDLNQKPTILAGAHPLTWGEAQLFDGMSKAIFAARMQEALLQNKREL